MLHQLSRAALSRLLTYQLHRSLNRMDLALPLSAKPADAPDLHPTDVMLHRRNGAIAIGLPPDSSRLVFHARKNITAYLYLFEHCPPEVQAMSGACQDGHEASAARFAPSSRTPDTIALPDHYFVLRRGFAAERDLAAAQALPWAERRDTLVWRGGANGDGIHPQLPEDATNPRVIQRARLCMLLADTPGTDAKLTAGQDRARPLEVFAPLGLTGQPRPEAEWLGDKFAIDIDGWTNAWSNLLIRLHYGCCVLKIDSADGYRQWWYDRLIPWEHYVPVRADMSDLTEKLDWVRTNDAEAQGIAARGQQLARTMTLASETAVGAELITQHWSAN